MRKTCVVCKRRFTTGKASQQKMCSDDCKKSRKMEQDREYKKNHPTVHIPNPAANARTCEHCGIEFVPKSKNHPRQRFCSKSCNFASYAKTGDYATAKKQYKRREAATVTAIRGCLCCGRGFESKWIGNRVCDSCAGSEEYRCYALN